MAKAADRPQAFPREAPRRANATDVTIRTPSAERARRTLVGVGALIKEWRSMRNRSQMDLALQIGVSTRHLSFVETGRSRPSPELVLALAEGLDVPLTERNSFLLAAGYAPRHVDTSLDSPAMADVRAWLDQMIDAHDPYPGLVLDRRWNVVLANQAASALIDRLSDELRRPPVNVFRVFLHPAGLATRTVNFEEWGTYLLRQLRRLVASTDDAELRELEAEVSAYPTVQRLPAPIRRAEANEVPLLVSVHLTTGGPDLSLLTTFTTVGPPTDLSLVDLSVELFWPADTTSEVLLQAMAAKARDSVT